jgi:hypothetical protein
MKKALIVLFILTAILCHSKNSKIIEVAKFQGFNQWDELVNIRIIEYGIYKGFKVGTVYFLTEKYKYDLTIKNPGLNFSWYVFTRERNYLLSSRLPIWCLSFRDNENELITVTFNMALYTGGYIKNYFIEFKKNCLK